MSTFGKTTDGGSDLPTVNNRMGVSKFTLADTASLNNLFGLVNGNATEHIKGVIYSDSSGPSSLLVSSASVLVGSGIQWVQCPISGILTPGDYWLGYVIDANTAGMRYGAASNSLKYSDAAGNFSTPPASWPGGTTVASFEFSVYVDYTVAGGGRLVGGALVGGTLAGVLAQ